MPFHLRDLASCKSQACCTTEKNKVKITSRHTVVCRAAQEVGAQPREYIDRKKENVIFAPP